MKRSIAICFLALAGLSSSAYGDTVKLAYKNHNDGGGNINVAYTPKGWTNRSLATGFYTFQMTENQRIDPQPATDVDLFCFDLEQYTTTAVTEYEIKDPSAGPSDSLAGEMGPDRSHLIKRLFGQHYDDWLTPSISYSANDYKKAFQMVIWEFAHERPLVNSGKASGYDLANGVFQVVGSSDALTLANSWLDSTHLDYLADDAEEAVVWAFINEGYQDQLYVPPEGSTNVPCPTGLVSLLGLGLMTGLAAIRRRRRQP